MTRIADARKSYMMKDLDGQKRAHTKSAIHRSIIHKEEHRSRFNLPEIILGGQDGLVNVLGVILGVAAATSQSSIVIVAGLAATFAESVSMAAVAYTSKVAEADYYQSEYEREKYEIEHFPEGEREEIRALYTAYGFDGDTLEKIVDKITSNHKVWLRVMMEQELKLEVVDRKDGIPSAFIVGTSALVGSFVPLTPFFFLPVYSATLVALIISAVTLFSVGYYKAYTTLGRKLKRSGLEMMVIGLVSAMVGYLVGVIFRVPMS
jgi:VIT1/CCC1 family predicted Fe2+/Mn2+ transporter